VTRVVIGCCLLSLLFGLFLFRDNGVQAPPNILLLVVDDMGNNDLAIAGDGMAPTPSLDEFARQGVRFSRHYADSTCAPARAALMSGRFPARAGFSPEGPGLSPQVPTLPRLLKQLGYRTHHIGKWHMGHISPLAWPTSVGFDSSLSFHNQWLMRGPSLHPITEDMYTSSNYMNPWLSDGPSDNRQYQGYLTDILLDRTLSLIDSESKKTPPWFISHWFFLPHSPIQPASRYARQFPATPEGRYLAMLKHLDDSVQQVLEKLDESGQSDNTIVVIVSDNGGTNVQRDNNWPYFGKKVQLNEGGLRTPLMIRWPDAYPIGKVIDGVTSIMDIMPTLLTAAGLEQLPDLDGVDLNRSIKDDAVLPGRALFWEFHVYDRYGFSVLSPDGRWRLNSYAWRLNSFPWPKIEEPILVLNDLQQDPSGEENVAESYPEKVTELFGLYSQWFIESHRVALTYKSKGANGKAEVSGDDLQRTPGEGPFTFALSVSNYHHAGDDAPVSLVEQQDVWGINLNPASGLLTVSLANIQLQGRMVESLGCQSVFVTGEFFRRKTNWRNNNDRLRLSLYINGEIVNEVDVPDFIQADLAATNPTLIGGKVESNSFAGILGQPQIFNAVVSEQGILTPSRLHKDLCPRAL